MLALEAARRHLDVMFNPGFTAPLAAPCPQVTMFHDLQHKRHPENFRWFDLPVWRFFLFWSAHVSRLLLAPSQATADDLKRYYRLPEGKVRVAQHGVDAAFFGIAGRRRPERFLLAVSTLHPHKNLDALLRAYAGFRERHPDIRLVVCGLHGFSAGYLHNLREALGLRDAVDFPGLDSARGSLRSVLARLGVRLSVAVRGFRPAGSGSAGRRGADRMLGRRAAQFHRRRGCPAVRSARPASVARCHVPHHRGRRVAAQRSRSPARRARPTSPGGLPPRPRSRRWKTRRRRRAGRGLGVARIMGAMSAVSMWKPRMRRAAPVSSLPILFSGSSGHRVIYSRVAGRLGQEGYPCNAQISAGWR